MGGHNAVGTPSGARRCSADGKIALGLQSQTSVRQAARHPRQPGETGPPPREAFEGATDDRYCGPAIDAGIPSRVRARPQPSRTEGVVRKLEERKGAVLL